MDVDRRLVLKSIALGSIAGLGLGATTRASASRASLSTDFAADQALMALVNEDGAGSAFLHGAMAANGHVQVQRIGCDLHGLLDFERQLHARPRMRIIGLLDDAVATLVVDLARSAGARIQWLGQHTAQAGYTRHRLLNTDGAGTCSRQLARELHAFGGGFDIVEEQQSSLVSQLRLSAQPRTSEHSAEWACGVGCVLASLRSKQLTSATPAPLGNAVADGSFVSFSIEAEESVRG